MGMSPNEINMLLESCYRLTGFIKRGILRDQLNNLQVLWTFTFLTLPLL